MSRALQWKLIVGFLLVFIAGGVTGAWAARGDESAATATATIAARNNIFMWVSLVS